MFSSGTNTVRSVYLPPEAAPLNSEPTVGPMDTSLAVAGMEKSFSSSPAMEAGRTIDLSGDQGARRWSLLNQNPEVFGKDIYQTSCQGNTNFLGSNTTRRHGPEGNQGQPYIYQRASGMIIQRGSQAIHPNKPIQSLPEKFPAQKQEQRAHPSLSNAPQTKAEQQRLAYQKLPQTNMEDTVPSPLVEPVKLEDLVLRILYEATNSTERDDGLLKEPRRSKNLITLTKGGALKASQAISSLIRQSTGSDCTVQRRVHPGFISNAKVCPKCNYAVARDCDLRKHMKRHEKPYGCTYPNCHKRFGAKSDWKRHENSQHFQPEAFRCAKPSLSTLGSACSRHFFRIQEFEGHLRTDHRICDPEQLNDQVTKCTIGKNCQGRFWCGFCKVVIELKERRNAAWDERFDHIAQHFEKERKNIDEWVCVEENKTKKELLKEMDRYVLDDEEERDVDAIGEVDDDVMTVPANMMPDQTSIARNQGPPTRQAPASQDMASKKRKRADGETPYAVKKRITTRFKLCVRRPISARLSLLTLAVSMLRRPLASAFEFIVHVMFASFM